MKEKVFIKLYADYECQFDLLSDNQLGILLRAIYKFENRSENPDFGTDAALNIMWAGVKKNLERQREWEQQKSDTNRENGRKGGRPRKVRTDESEEIDESKVSSMMTRLDFSPVDDSLLEDFKEWIKHKLTLGFRPTKNLVKKEYDTLTDYSDGDSERAKEIIETCIANNYRVLKE